MERRDAVGQARRHLQIRSKVRSKKLDKNKHETKTTNTIKTKQARTATLLAIYHPGACLPVRIIHNGGLGLA